MNRITFLLLILFVACQPAKEKNPYLKTGDGFAEVKGGKVWYGIIGEGEKAPLLCLHGGPGGTSRGYLNLIDLTNDRPIILMDQLGSGFSSFHEDSTLLKVENFVEQVRAVKEALSLNEFYLVGHSWGTALALEYFSAYPYGVKGIVFNSPYFSTSTWIADTDTLISTLPDSIQLSIKTAEEGNLYETESYKQAMDVFAKNFIVRKDRSEINIPSYKAIKDSYDTVVVRGNDFIYNYMWGPSEFSPTGTLLDYENIDALAQIDVPVLFTTGEYDEARPVTVKGYTSMVANGEYVEIPNAGHGSSVDNQKAYVKAHRDFANRIDEAADK